MSKRGYLIRKAKRDKFIAQHINETHIQAFLERKLKEAVEQIGLDKTEWCCVSVEQATYSKRTQVVVTIPGFSSVGDTSELISEHIETARKFNELEKLKTK